MGDHRSISIVDVFTRDAFEGTPTAVVHDASDLSTAQLQTIASEVGATVAAEDGMLHAVTSEGERPSVAAVIAAHAATDASADESIETPEGTYPVSRDDRTWVSGFEASLRTVEAGYERVADALGIGTAALAGVGEDLPIARASIGHPVLVVPVNYFEQVGDIEPDAAATAALCTEFGADTLAVYTFDTLDRDSTVHCRAFDASDSIAERPASGLVGGAVGATLRRFSGIDATEFVCEQGAFLDRPGRVAVRTSDDIAVGGHHATALTGDIAVPDEESDDLIEV